MFENFKKVANDNEQPKGNESEPRRAFETQEAAYTYGAEKAKEILDGIDPSLSGAERWSEIARLGNELDTNDWSNYYVAKVLEEVITIEKLLAEASDKMSVHPEAAEMALVPESLQQAA